MRRRALAQVAAAADEGHREVVLVDVVGLIGGGEHLGLVDVVDAEGLEDAGLDEVADAGLGHDGDADGLGDAHDNLGVAHAGDAAVLADVGGDALEGHDGAGAGFLGDLGVLGRHDVHDDAALEHLRQAGLHGPGSPLARSVLTDVFETLDCFALAHDLLLRLTGGLVSFLRAASLGRFRVSGWRGGGRA